MTNEVLFAFGVLGVVAMKVVWDAVQPRMPDVDPNIVKWSAEAIEVTKSCSTIQLNYSIESIQKVDEVLAALHPEAGSMPENVLAGTSRIYGAYVGECIRRHHSGNAYWEHNNFDVDRPSYILHWGGIEVYPMVWCLRRLQNPENEAMWPKYLITISMHNKAGT